MAVNPVDPVVSVKLKGDDFADAAEAEVFVAFLCDVVKCRVKRIVEVQRPPVHWEPLSKAYELRKVRDKKNPGRWVASNKLMDALMTEVKPVKDGSEGRIFVDPGQ